MNSAEHSAAAARDLADEVVAKLRAAGFQALFAGGCVRDLLMQRTPQDYDVATDATPEQVTTLFGRRRALLVGESFGVVIILGPRGADGRHAQVEVATFRTEGSYGDGRRPDRDQIRFSGPEDDARRRDFTINGMFFDPVAQAVLDYVGGEEDLARRTVRAIGDPRRRMQEDKLRMLRAARFAATMDFELDDDTAAAVRAMTTELRVVSAERIVQELRKMLVAPQRRRALELLRALGLLTVMLPQVAADAEQHSDEWSTTLTALDGLTQPDFELALALLWRRLPVAGAPSETVAHVGRELRLSNDEREQVCWLVAQHPEFMGPATLPTSRLKRLLAHSWAGNVEQMARALAGARQETLPVLEQAADFRTRFTPEEINPSPLLTGDDLIAQGYTPGRQFHVWLEAVRDAQLEARISTRLEALELVRLLATDRGSDPQVIG